MKFLDFHFPPMQPNISSELKNQHDVIEDSVCYAAFRYGMVHFPRVLESNNVFCWDILWVFVYKNK